MNNSTPIEEMLKSIKFFEEKIGKDVIAITSSGEKQSLNKFKIQLAMLEKELDSDHIYNLTYDNLRNFMVKSLQEYPVKMIWR